ncbi:MAG: AraC family transcriptional regulator [Clostridia bacterium]
MAKAFEFKDYKFFYTPSYYMKENYIVSELMWHLKRDNLSYDRKSFDSNIVIYIMSGKFHVEQYGKKITLSKGQSILMTIKDKHHYYTDPVDTAEIIFFHFDGKPCENIINRLKVHSKLPVISNDPKVKDAIIKCFETTYKKDDCFEYTISSIIYSLIIKMSIESLSSIDKQAEGGLESNSEICKFILSKIYEKNIKIDDFCNHFGMSKTNLYKFFSKEMQKSPMQCVNELKIIEAKKLLLGTDKNVDYIAQKLFFSDQSHLTKIFKETVGVTPNVYRKKFKYV